MGVQETETVALLALLRADLKDLTWPEIATEVSLRGSAVSVWDEYVVDRAPTLFGDTTGDDILKSVRRDLDRWRGQDLHLVTILDEEYPTALRMIHQMPPFLFARGRVYPDDPAVSVVGSRRASDRGLAVAGHIARGLVDRGITVLSGLAAGVDAAAHAATIEAGGRPVGVIGTGINGSYPASNRTLQRQVAEHGAVLSQFWPDAPPRPAHFPMRNATMSGLGIATVVVEAGEHSGARIQARIAVEHGRPVILTDLVVRDNEWARALLTRPGVHQASSTAEVVAVVEQIARQAPSIVNININIGELLAR